MKLKKKDVKITKQLTSLILIFVMILGIMPTISLPTKATDSKFIAPIEPPITGSIPISNRAELEAIRNNLSGTYHLTQDIDLSGAEWVPIDYFSGTFDGQGYSINNLYILESSNREYAGLFGFMYSHGFIKNVGINIGVQGIFSSSYAGGLIGESWIQGTNTITITNCYSTGNVTSYSTSSNYAYAGGLIGCVLGIGKPIEITDCYATGSISADNIFNDSFSFAYAGGLIGSIVGGITSTIKNSYATGNISANSYSFSYAGGLIGYAVLEEIKNSYATGNVFIDIPIIDSLYSTSANAGGLIGCASGYDDKPIVITDCYATGNVFIDIPIIDSLYSTSANAGGLIGKGNQRMIVKNCYAIGKVDVFNGGAFSHSLAGGLIGGFSNFANSRYTITDCYATGSVSASSHVYAYAGGLIGDYQMSVNLTITNCYAVGDVSAISTYFYGLYSYAGGLIGNDDSVYGDILTINNCYRLITQTISSGTKNEIGTPLTNSQMKQQSSFVGFDFNTVWAIDPNINNGFPYLRGGGSTEVIENTAEAKNFFLSRQSIALNNDNIGFKLNGIIFGNGNKIDLIRVQIYNNRGGRFYYTYGEKENEHPIDEFNLRNVPAFTTPNSVINQSGVYNIKIFARTLGAINGKEVAFGNVSIFEESINYIQADDTPLRNDSRESATILKRLAKDTEVTYWGITTETIDGKRWSLITSDGISGWCDADMVKPSKVGTLVWPTRDEDKTNHKYEVTSDYLEIRTDHIHQGIDIFPSERNAKDISSNDYYLGRYAISVTKGIVERVWYATGGGNSVQIKVENFLGDGKPGYLTYMHLHSTRVNKGDPVDPGTILGVIGNTASVSSTWRFGIHLHFSILGIPYKFESQSDSRDPMNYIGNIRPIGLKAYDKAARWRNDVSNFNNYSTIPENPNLKGGDMINEIPNMVTEYSVENLITQENSFYYSQWYSQWFEKEKLLVRYFNIKGEYLDSTYYIFDEDSRTELYVPASTSMIKFDLNSLTPETGLFIKADEQNVDDWILLFDEEEINLQITLDNLHGAREFGITIKRNAPETQSSQNWITTVIKDSNERIVYSSEFDLTQNSEISLVVPYDSEYIGFGFSTENLHTTINGFANGISFLTNSEYKISDDVTEFQFISIAEDGISKSVYILNLNKGEAGGMTKVVTEKNNSVKEIKDYFGNVSDLEIIKKEKGKSSETITNDNNAKVGTGTEIWIDGDLVAIVVIYGDINGDGYITKDDATIILRYVVGSEELDEYQTEAADVFGNNSEITSANATYILRYIDGVETEIGVDVTSSANIDYTQPDIIITGKINNKETSDYKINLSKEIITLSSSNPIKAYSIDGGTKWKAVKSDTFIAGNFQKLLNKDMELWLSDTLPDKATKQPPKGAEIIKFSKINKRPKAPKLSVQYEMVEDTSKTLSQWVLSGKSNSSAEKENLEIGVASTTKKGVDEKGYGKIIVTNGVTMKARKTIYYVRYAPTENGTEYTAGSNPQKIVVLGEQKTPKKNILEVFNSIVKYLFKL